MSKIQDFIGKRNLFFWSLPISPWASFATWLHLGAPPKNTKKINKNRLPNIEFVLTHMPEEVTRYKHYQTMWRMQLNGWEVKITKLLDIM